MQAGMYLPKCSSRPLSREILYQAKDMEKLNYVHLANESRKSKKKSQHIIAAYVLTEGYFIGKGGAVRIKKYLYYRVKQMRFPFFSPLILLYAYKDLRNFTPLCK